MKPLPTAALVAMLVGSALAADSYEFDTPRIVEADGAFVEVESPGYAAPCLADLNGDGVRDLLVGQYKDGKIAVYTGLTTEDGSLAFGARRWLRAGDEIATVPGIW